MAFAQSWVANVTSWLEQRAMPVLFVHPGKNYMLSATGVLSPSMSLEMSVGHAKNSLDFQLQNPNLYRSAAGLTGLPLLFPDAVQSDYIPWFEFRGGRTANAGQYQTDRGPFTNENQTTDVFANLSKVWGNHSSKFGASFQHSYKPQSIFGKSFAPFGLLAGTNFMEYDLVYLSHDMLFWGARNIDGRGFDKEENRPTNLQIPLVRK